MVAATSVGPETGTTVGATWVLERMLEGANAVEPGGDRWVGAGRENQVLSVTTYCCTPTCSIPSVIAGHKYCQLLVPVFILASDIQ